MEKLRRGDFVEWSTSQGRATGVVRKVITKDTRVRGALLKGSEEDPVYIVRSTGPEGDTDSREVALKRRP